MQFNLQALLPRTLEIAWESLGVFWLAASVFSKRTVKRQSAARRAVTLILGVIPFFLLFSPYFRYGLLRRRFVPENPTIAVAGLALTFAGMALAIWARIILGRNWSSAVTVKLDHQLIQRGPYSIVRHPIYSGLLLALLGGALIMRELGGLAAVGFALLIWLFKSRQEERFMVDKFGKEYEEYRRSTRALVPYLL